MGADTGAFLSFHCLGLKCREMLCIKIWQRNYAISAAPLEILTALVCAKLGLLLKILVSVTENLPRFQLKSIQQGLDGTNCAGRMVARKAREQILDRFSKAGLKISSRKCWRFIQSGFSSCSNTTNAIIRGAFFSDC